MANLCYGSIKVVLPLDKRNEFLSHFDLDFKDDKVVKSKRQTNLRLISLNDEMVSKNEKFVQLEFDFECGWSVQSASLDLSDSDKFISLKTLFKECDVRVFYLEDEEPGFEFEEQIEYVKDDEAEEINIPIKCRDYWPDASNYYAGLDFCE